MTRTHGSVETGIRTLRARFDRLHERKGRDECWPWIGKIGSDGYPRIRIGPRHRRATHASVFLNHGHWPMPGMCVCHRCDNPGCVNPSHLYVGTHHENHREKKERRRAVGRGCAIPKLRGVVLEMLARHDAGESLAQLAAAYGVSKEAIKYHIRKRKRWNHVSQP